MKILLLTYENDVNAFAQIAKQFKADGHDVGIFSCDFFSVTVANNYSQKELRNSGFSVREIGSLEEELYTINTIESDQDVSVDYGYLVDVERKLKSGRTLNNLIALDYVVTQVGHSRTYVERPKNKEIVYKTLELCLKKSFKFFEEINPDVVFTYSNNHLVKNIFYEIALIKGVPFLALDTCRVNNRFILLDNLWIGTSEFIKAEMKKLEESNDPCEEAMKYIDNMIKNNVQAYSFEGVYDLNNQKKYDFLYQLKPVLRSLLSLPRATLNEVRDHAKRNVRNRYFFPNYPFTVFLYNLQSVFRIRSYFQSKVLNQVCPEGPYVFIPLHMIPENNIFTEPELISELEIIKQISRVVPVDYKVVVKANPSMLIRFADTHPSSFYEKINEIHNVVIVSPKLKSMPIISKAKAVVSISGTSLMEAAVLGIPAFAYGNPEFLAMDGVERFDKKTFMQVLFFKSSIGKRAQKYYIQAVLNNSVDLEFSKYYMADKATSETKSFVDNFAKKIKELIINTYEKSR